MNDLFSQSADNQAVFAGFERLIFIVFSCLHSKFGYGDLYVKIYENSSKINLILIAAVLSVPAANAQPIGKQVPQEITGGVQIETHSTLYNQVYIAFAPQHLFIRHRDEMEPNKWVNVELTTQSLSREIFYIENFGISDAAIRNKVCLNPLTDKETIAYLLSELATGYLRKYEDYDDLIWLCATKSIEYYPQNITALHQKGNIINIRLMEYLAYNGRVYDDYAQLLDNKWKENFELVKELGWTEMGDDIYEKLLQDTENAMKADGVDEAEINAEIEKAR